MRKILLALFLACSMISCSPADTIADQEKVCNAVLWKQQLQWDLTSYYIILHVKHEGQLKSKDVWGDAFQEPGTPLTIEILALEDYPAQIPLNVRRELQKGVVVHEVLHIVLDRIGVPPQAQDVIIETLRPGVKVP